MGRVKLQYVMAVGMIKTVILSVFREIAFLLSPSTPNISFASGNSASEDNKNAIFLLKITVYYDVIASLFVTLQER
jgi:hypothetical protein